MRSISAAIIVMSGSVLMAAATAQGIPDNARGGYLVVGALIGIIGLVAWLVELIGRRGSD